MIAKAVFLLLAFMTLVPAVLAVTLKNIFHCGLFLVLSLMGVAGFFAMLGSDFLFAAQVLVYAGGITVLVLFVVLLSGRPSDWIQRQLNGLWGWAAFVAATFLALLATLYSHLPDAPALAPSEPVSASIGLLLLKDMVLPFEAVSLVLLAALIGAIHFSRKET